MGDHDEVICPNCRTNLLRKERTGRRCSRCHKTFALEPKEDHFGMHDERMRRLVDKLRDDQDLRYTGRQLYYAAGRKHLPSPTATWVTTFITLGFVVLVLSIICVAAIDAVPAKIGAPGIGLALLALTVLMVLVRPWFISRATVRMTRGYRDFRSGVIDVWRKHYGAGPPGMIPDDLPLPAVPRPRLALLCPDRATLTCLAANDAAGAWGMALCERIEQLPPAVPVLILHDAAVPGVDYANRVRASLGPRAVPIGLTPAMVRKAASVTKLRERAEPDARLPPSWTEDDRQWLREGWWTPLSALPPARLLGVVRRGVDRIEVSADPERRTARQVGFLTWPSS
ncbi:hypothetical protein [Nocardia higoensis]|uniref:hypothetical protein n=1 Tax=Nocardia higoensis TaxID=228599 RepID=UPI0003039C52|nr:hypothetical protein [Nocardia higoensis]